MRTGSAHPIACTRIRYLKVGKYAYELRAGHAAICTIGHKTFAQVSSPGTGIVHHGSASLLVDYVLELVVDQIKAVWVELPLRFRLPVGAERRCENDLCARERGRGVSCVSSATTTKHALYMPVFSM